MRPTYLPNKLTIFLAVMLTLAVVVIAVGSILFRQSLKEHGEDSRSLYRAKKELQLYKDSLKVADIKLANREKYWIEAFRNQEVRFRNQRKDTKQKEIVYEKAFTTPPPAWDKPELDSIGDAILTRRLGRP